jgi:hypothetical protein
LSSRIEPHKGCDPDIVDALEDLQKQATLERSHFYVGKVAVLAQAEIKALRWQLDEAQRLLKMYDDGIRPQPDRHADGCECAACWQAMESGGGRG